MGFFNFIKNKVKAIIGAFSGDPRYVQHFDWDPTKGGGGGFEPTEVQLAAINSGATSTKIDQIATNTTNITNKLDKLTDTGEFVYSHDGSVQTSKGFEVADEPSGSAAHVTSSKTVKAVKTALENSKADKATTLAGYGITNAYTKTETNDLLDDKQDLELGHLYDSHDGYKDSEQCVFNFTPSSSFDTESTRIIEKRAFTARMTNPINSSTITGFIETQQFLVPSGATIYIEQTFTQEQSAVSGNIVKFKRKGSVSISSMTNYTNWVSSYQSSITWGAWIPIEYPEQALQLNSTYVTAGNLKYTISGGNMTIVFDGIKTSTTVGDLTITINYPAWIANVFKPTVSPMTTLHNTAINNSCLAVCTRNSCRLYSPTTGTLYWGSLTVPLGY